MAHINDNEKGDKIPRPELNHDNIKRWITCNADEEMISFVEVSAKYMAQEKMTTSQIRNIYGEIKRIQMNYEAERVAFLLLKPKVAYMLARNKNNDGLKLFNDIFKAAAQHVVNDSTYTNFCNMMEALVAYHRVYEEENKKD